MTVFSPLNCICFFVKDWFTVFLWIYFWTLSCVFTDSFVLLPVTHCLGYSSLMLLLLFLFLFSCPVGSDSWRPRGLQHTSPLCSSPSPKVCPSSCLLRRWCHPAISSSDALFFCPQSFPASETFPLSQLFTSNDQITGVSASASVLPISIQDWFPLGLTGLISLLSKWLRCLLQHGSLKASIFDAFTVSCFIVSVKDG